MRAKSKLTITMVMLFTTFSIGNILAQTPEKSYLDVRIFAGVNLSSLSTEGTQITLVDSIVHNKGVEAEMGYQFGGAVTFGNHFYISPGLWYTKFTLNSYLFDNNGNNNDDKDFEKESSISMISIPVRLGYRFINPNTTGAFNARIFGGVTGQHVLSVSTSGDEEIQIDKDDYENLILSATAGLGVDILFLYMDLGYDLGLTNFEKSNDKSRHNSLFINVGAKFKL